MTYLAPLRALALIAAVAGAAGSVGLTLQVGRRNRSLVLMALFVVWVLSPFVAVIWAHVVSRRWSVLNRSILYIAILILTLGSLASYGAVAFGPPRPKPAFVFLVVPLASWLLFAIVVLAAAFLSARLSRPR